MLAIPYSRTVTRLNFLSRMPNLGPGYGRGVGGTARLPGPAESCRPHARNSRAILRPLWMANPECCSRPSMNERVYGARADRIPRSDYCWSLYASFLSDKILKAPAGLARVCFSMCVCGGGGHLGSSAGGDGVSINDTALLGTLAVRFEHVDGGDGVAHAAVVLGDLPHRARQ